MVRPIMPPPDFIPDSPAKTAPAADFIPDSSSPAPLVQPEDAAPLPENHPILQALKGYAQGLQNTFDTNTTPTPGESLGSRYLKRTTATVGAPLVHPLDFAKGMLDSRFPSADTLTQQTNDPNKPTLSEGLTDAAGGLTGAALLGRTGKGIIDGARAIPERFGNPSPNYVPPVEQSVRGLVKSLNLPVNSVEPLIKDLMGPNGDGSTAGIIRQYAAKAGKPITGPLDAAKLAQKAGTDVLAHYESILKPIEGEQASVRSTNSPIGFGEGKNATLRAINDRVTHINQQLDAARDAQAAGLPSPIANADELAGEARGLNSVLYNKIAKLTGIPEEQISNLRQTYGKLFSAGTTLTRAANAVKDAASKSPKTAVEAVTRGVDKLQGGTEGVFNRRFRSTLPELPVTEPTLPQAGGPIPTSPLRAPVWDGLVNTPPETPQLTPDMEGAAQARAATQATREAAAQARAQAAQLEQLKSQEEFLKMHQTEQTAQDLAANRAAQAKLIRDQRIQARRDLHPIWRTNPLQ